MTFAPKRLLFLSLMTAAAFIVAVVAVAAPSRARAEVEVSAEASFGAPLAPYGEWVVVAHHGRVWRPRGVAVGWRPYYHGRWVWTDDGWFWDSDEPWGWATYHYGRWYADPAFGWVWVPGNTWAPAWVTWRFGGGAIGWAPLLPGFSVWWTAGYPVSGAAWVFVPEQRFVGAPVERVAFAPTRTAALLSTTRFAPPRSVSGASAPRLGGPSRQFVESRVGHPIATTRLAAAASPQAARSGRGEGVVSVYRPSHLGAAQPASHGATGRAAHAAAAPSASHGTARSAQHASTERAAPHAATTRSAPHAATAHAPAHTAATHSAHTATARATPHAATAHSAPHAATARSAPHGATARPAPHAEATRSSPHAAARPAAHASTSSPHVAAAQHGSPPAQHASPPAQHATAPQGTAPQGHAATQSRPPPAAHAAPARQAQRSSGHSAT